MPETIYILAHSQDKVKPNNPPFKLDLGNCLTPPKIIAVQESHLHVDYTLSSPFFCIFMVTTSSPSLPSSSCFLAHFIPCSLCTCIQFIIDVHIKGNRSTRIRGSSTCVTVDSLGIIFIMWFINTLDSSLSVT